MSPGPTFDRVYLALKDQLMEGRFAPGAHLEPAALGLDLNASITPVRDALHRLVGERLVEAPRHNGFTVPAPTEAELRDLYGWNAQLLSLALGKRRPAGRGVPSDRAHAGEQVPSAAALFLDIGRGSGSDEHARAVASVGDRLATARLAEPLLLGDTEAECAALAHAFDAEDVPALRKAISAYHKRRQRCVPDLLVLMRQGLRVQ